MPERIRRKEPTYPNIDLTIPVDTTTMNNNVTAEDCFSREWKPDDKLCSLCSDIEICGILYNSRLSTKVKAIEAAKGGYLDNMHFDDIDREEVIDWLKLKPRTGKQFIDMIQKFTACPDRETCKYWCISYIKETKGVSLSPDKIIIVK